MSMSTFSFLIAIVFSAMTLVFTMLGITFQDDVAVFMGYTLGYGTVVLTIVGFYLLWTGE